MQAQHDLLLMRLDGAHHFWHQAQARHVLESQVPNVGFLYRHELSKQGHALRENFGVHVEVHHQRDALEENGMQRVVLVGVLINRRARDGSSENFRQLCPDVVILNDWKVVQHSEGLDVEPRGRDAVVGVVLRNVNALCHPLQDTNHLGYHDLVAFGIHGDHAAKQRHAAQKHAQVPLLKQVANLQGEGVDVYDIRISPEESQHTECRLLPHHSSR
mmetsp:Transcript_9950/g.18784  ORF Transcript_9950/g.18784 Transcript_9950/m.18784 type:complete len:216 (-) Transcript_9950:154-801(-)